MGLDKIRIELHTNYSIFLRGSSILIPNNFDKARFNLMDLFFNFASVAIEIK